MYPGKKASLCHLVITLSNEELIYLTALWDALLIYNDKLSNLPFPPLMKNYLKVLFGTSPFNKLPFSIEWGPVFMGLRIRHNVNTEQNLIYLIPFLYNLHLTQKRNQVKATFTQVVRDENHNGN